MSKEQEARLILSDVLSIPIECVDGSIQIGSTQQWDSMAHMNIVLVAEKQIGRTLQPIEFIEIENLETLMTVLKAV